MTKQILLLTCAVGAFSGFAGVGLASAADSSSSPSATEVGAVIVTAEKRAQNIQKVPVAVTAFTTKQRDLVGIENLQDMTNFTPGLVYSSVLDRVTLRGIGRQTNLLSADAAVATYVDGFFTTSAVEASKPPMFVSNIEVLRGPQGTLQGRNAIAGALLVTTARPTSTPYAEVRVNAGSYGFVDTEVAVSGPLADGLDFRLQGYDTVQTQGYFKNVAPGPSEGNVLNEYYVEPSFTAKLGDNADLYVKAFVAGWNNRGGPGARADYTTGPYGTQLNDRSSGIFFNAAAGYNPLNYVGASSTGFLVPGSLQQTNPGVTQSPVLQNIRDFSDNTPLSVKLNNARDVDTEFTYHFPSFDFKYVGGFQSYKYDLTQDYDGTDVTSYQIGCNPGTTCAFTAPLTVFPNGFSLYEENNQWYSHEVTLASTGSNPLQWIAGGYFYDEHYSNPISTAYDQQSQLVHPISFVGITPVADPSHQTSYTDYHMVTRSEAVYGQIDYKLNNQFKFTVGLRYTDDHKAGDEEQRYVFFGGQILGALYQTDIPGVEPTGGPLNPQNLGIYTPAADVTACPAIPPGGPAKGVASTCFINALGQAQRNLEDTSTATTGTAGVEWTPTDSFLGYARYSRGYKSFGFNAGQLSEFPETKPEFVNSYELGAKQSWGRNLVVDAAVYYYDFTDAQYPLSTQVLIAGVGEQNVGLLTNLPKTRSDGFELESIWTPIDHLQFDLSYSFNDTAILTGCHVTNTSPTIGAGTGACYVDTEDPQGLAPGARPAFTNAGSVFQTVKGNQLPNAPRNKVALNSNYTFVFDQGSLTLSGTYIWRDVQYGSIFKEPYDEAPSWSQVDLRATWKGPSDRYEVIVYGRNVFNTVGYEAAADGGLISSSLNGTGYTQNHLYGINPPATYGVELHYKFF